MISEYAGKIFKLPFPFTNLSASKSRPALALCEPNEYGDIEFVFITTKKPKHFAHTLSLPEGLLPFPSEIHIGKLFLLNKQIIIKELAQTEQSFFENVLKAVVLNAARRYFENTHRHQEKKRFIAGVSRINYAGRVFDEKEIINLVDASLEFWLTYGRYSREFEKKLAEFLGVQYAFIVNSGSSANLLAFMSLTSPLLKERQIKKGDEVITVAAGFPTTVAPIIQYGAVPVFVDIDLETFNIDTAQLEYALSPSTKAVMLAHTLGNPFNIKAVKDFCKKHNLWLIEDNCDALGSKYQGKYTGIYGDIGTSSFYPPHHITTGEGGAVYTDNKILKKIILSMRDWGRDCWCESGRDNTCGCRFSRQYGTLPFGYDHKYVYSHFGYNLKATDMQAAVGCAQLEKLPEFIEKRRKNFDLLYEGLRECGDCFILPKATPHSEPAWFGFLITIRDNAAFTRNELVEYLESNNIQTRNLFAGNITKHPCFETLKNGIDFRIASGLKYTDKIMNDSFWLGVYPGMTEDMITFMIMKLCEFVSEKKRKQSK